MPSLTCPVAEGGSHGKKEEADGGPEGEEDGHTALEDNGQMGHPVGVDKGHASGERRKDQDWGKTIIFNETGQHNNHLRICTTTQVHVHGKNEFIQNWEGTVILLQTHCNTERDIGTDISTTWIQPNQILSSYTCGSTSDHSTHCIHAWNNSRTNLLS